MLAGPAAHVEPLAFIHQGTLANHWLVLHALETKYHVRSRLHIKWGEVADFCVLVFILTVPDSIHFIILFSLVFIRTLYC